MKKVSKILAITIVAVMLVGVLAGCALFGRETAKYRNTVVATVSNEEIKLGRVVDMFNTYYYQYYSYLQQGIFNIESVFNMTMEALYSTHMKVDSYKTSDPQTYAHSYSYANAKYLTEKEMEIVLRSVKYSMFSALDSYVESYIVAEVGELGDISEDTSRDFYEYDEMTTDTYAEKVYWDNISNEDADEYFEKYYESASVTPDIDDYVMTETSAAVRVEEYNKRLAKHFDDNKEKDEEGDAPTVTASKVVEWQQRALRAYAKTVDLNYGIDLPTMFNEQVETYILSIIVIKYDFSISSEIEKDAQAFKQRLTDTFNSAKDDTDTAYNLNADNYITFIEGLSNDSYIYSVPEEYKNSYVFVKNLLIPFNEKQLAQLQVFASKSGSTTSDEYLRYRNSLAAEIVAKNFNNDEAEESGFFKYDSATNKVLLDENGALAAKLPNDGTVTPEAFMELMSDYNTDSAGQHSNLYDYVVRVDGILPSAYSHKWVMEFVEATKDAIAAGGLHHYGIAVSSYGVHIVYYSSNIEAIEFNADNIYDTHTAEYRYMKTMYSAQLTLLRREDNDRLNDLYKYAEERKITLNNQFYKLLGNLGIEYDFEEAMTDPDAKTEQ
ncbi:MAG: hypothetical protein NC350_05230 [Corallococcus sp.]|nr:hypothetical protein [Corallococcus sp.]